MTTAQDGGKVVQGSNGPALDANGNPVVAAGTGGGGSAATQTPPAATQQPAKTEGASAATTDDKVIAQPAKTEPRDLGDDEQPKPGERITLSSEALGKRMDRATKARMREMFGTDDPAEVKTRLAELETLRKAEDDRKKAAMTELDRAKTEAVAQKERADRLEVAMQELRDSQDVADAAQALKGVADEFIKPKFWKHAAGELADYLGEKFTAEQLEALGDDAREKAVRDFFTQYVKDNPELAKEGAQATPAKTENGKPPATEKTVPLTTGNTKSGKEGPPVITTGKFAGKTAAPGHPNSMTAAEFSAWKRENNYNF